MKNMLHLTYENISAKVDRYSSGPINLDVDNTIDIVDLKDDEAVKRFDKRLEYDMFFRKRSELGLSLEKIVDSDGNKKFRCIKKSNSNNIGESASSRYVNDAVSAIKQYDILMQSDDLNSMCNAASIAKQYFTKNARKNTRTEIAKKYYSTLLDKGDWNSLKKAVGVAVKYFDSVKCKEANKMINIRLNERAIDLADDAISGCLNPDTSIEVYNRLVKLNKHSTLSKAIDFAKLHMNKQAAKDTADQLAKIIELKRIEQARTVHLKPNDKVGKHTIKMSEQYKILKPIIYHSFDEHPFIRELVERPKPTPKQATSRLNTQKSSSKKDNQSVYEAQCLVETAENALRDEFRRRGGNILTPRLRSKSNMLTEIVKSNADMIGTSTLPPHPSLETYCAPPTKKDPAKAYQTISRMKSVLPPHPDRKYIKKVQRIKNVKAFIAKQKQDNGRNNKGKIRPPAHAA